MTSFYVPCIIDEVANRQNPVRLTRSGWCRRGGSCSADIIGSAKSVTIEASAAVYSLSRVAITLVFPMMIYFKSDQLAMIVH